MLGGAGGYIKVPTHPVTTSGSYTIVIGAGGNGDSTYGSGSAGGNTTLAGTGLTGTKTASGGAVGTSSSGGAGGGTSGSGESMVGYTGGAGTQGTGGAVGVYATGRAGPAGSGNATYRGTNSGLTDAGGGGIGNSGFGIICGGSRAPVRTWDGQYVGGVSPATGDDLCGAAQVNVSSNSSTFVVGGNATIGGGGGSGVNSYHVNWGYGGRGGDGIILIQYLPF